jgi:hypothetical protein
MRLIGFIPTLLILLTTVTFARPVPEAGTPRRVVQAAAETPLIEQVRHQVLTATADLPDFLADQTIRRSLIGQGLPVWLDTLETTVRHTHDGKEKTQVVFVISATAARFRKYEEMDNILSIGSFSGQMTALFRPSSQAVFTPAGEDRYRNRQCVVYSYRVPRETSVFLLRVARSDSRKCLLPVGYSGRIWVDPETKLVLRVEQAADDILPDFPMSAAEMTIDYGWVTISGERYWMPVTGEALAEFRSLGKTFLNVIEFRNYRKFDGDVKVVD